MTTLRDSDYPANGGRIIDMGGVVDADCEEDYGEGKNLVIFGIDPGHSTGWSALKVPVRRLMAEGVSRTLAHCRWRHGTVLRSGLGTGPMGLAVSDSRHVSLILDQAREIYDEFVSVPDEDDEWEEDVFVFAIEWFKLRMMSMDDNLLAPVRVQERLVDRMWVAESSLPVFLQTPSDAKSSVTDARLKRWLMYDPHSGPHARDADRHAILLLRRFADSREIQAGLGFGEGGS